MTTEKERMLIEALEVIKAGPMAMAGWCIKHGFHRGTFIHETGVGSLTDFVVGAALGMWYGSGDED